MAKSKHSQELKLEVIKYYINEHKGYKNTANKFNISYTTVKRWLNKYEEHGIKGLSKNTQTSYSRKFKENVLKYMYDNHLSYTETTMHFNLGCVSLVSKWDRIYKEEGYVGLENKKRGRNKKMNLKKKKEKMTKEELIQENEQLRMENAYLKKLQALVQERTKPQQEKK